MRFVASSIPLFFRTKSSYLLLFLLNFFPFLSFCTNIAWSSVEYVHRRVYTLLKTEQNFIEIYSVSDEFFHDKCKKGFKDKSGVFRKTAVFSSTVLRKSVNGNENKKVRKFSEREGYMPFPWKKWGETKAKKKKGNLFRKNLFSLKYTLSTIVSYRREKIFKFKILVACELNNVFFA